MTSGNVPQEYLIEQDTFNKNDTQDINCKEKHVIHSHADTGYDPYEQHQTCSPGITYTLEKDMIPRTYFIVTVVVTLCFNCPIGLLAMLCSVYSHSAFCRGEVTRGRCLARLALLLSLFGIIVTISVVMSVVFYVTSESGSKYRL